MKNFTTLMGASLCIFSSCMIRTKNDVDGGTGSNLKTVTINQPDYKSDLRSTLSDADKKSVMDSLVYSVSINPVQKSGVDDCATGVVGTKFNSEVLKLENLTVGSIKVMRGCNYTVSMKVGAKSDDEKTIKTLYFTSWDDKEPSLLPREELEKPSPNAIVKLFVTSEGKKFWDAVEIVTPGESDTKIEPQIAKKFSLNATTPTLLFVKDKGIVGSADFTPSMISKSDMYCGVALRQVETDGKGSQYALPEKDLGIYVVNGKLEESVVKFTANVISTAGVKNFLDKSGNQTNSNVSGSTIPYAYCAETQADALKLLKACVDNLGKSTECMGDIDPVHF